MWHGASREYPLEWPVSDQILVEGLEDLIGAAVVYGVCADVVEADPLTLRSLALGVIAELLMDGYMRSGSNTANRWEYWDCSPEEAIARIIRSWKELGPEGPLPMWSVVWLEITDKGEERARELIRGSGGRLSERPGDPAVVEDEGTSSP